MRHATQNSEEVVARPGYGVVPCNRKNSVPLPIGTVTVFCSPTTDGVASVTGAQTTGGCKLVVDSR